MIVIFISKVGRNLHRIFTFCVGSFLLFSMPFSCIIQFNNDRSAYVTPEEQKYIKEFSLEDTLKETDVKFSSDITIQKIGGDKILLFTKEYNYTWVILWGTWCKPCIASLPKYKEYQDKYKDKGLKIILVCDSYNITFLQKVLFDSGWRTQTYVLDKDKYGDNIRKKALRLRSDICSSCSLENEYSGYPQYYLFNKSSEILYFGTGSVEEIEKMLDRLK